MNKKYRNILFCVPLAVVFLFFSCATSSSTPSSGEGEIVSVNISKKGNKNYFSGIDSHIMDLIESGSPHNIKQAYSLLHKVTEDEYTEKEKILVSLCDSLMKILWPSEDYSFEVPSEIISNPYTGAVESALRGIYDSSTGNSDFLSTILPSLVLVTSDSRNDYFDSSLAALTECQKIHPDSVMVNYLLGILYLKENQSESALNCFTLCQKTCGDNYEILYGQCRAFFQLNQFEKCLSIADSVLEKNPQNLDMLELAAKSTYGLNNLEKSESYVIRILLLEPENLEYVLFRAKILVDKGDYIRASSLLDVYSRSNDTSRDYLLLRAKLQRDWNKNYNASLETITKAVNLYPEDYDVLLYACEIASLTNSKINGKTALEIANQLLIDNPKNVDVMKISVKEMIRQNQWNSAYELSSKIIRENPGDSEMIYSHADICLSLKKYDEAMNLASKMYNQNPNDTDAQQCYIKTLVKTGQNAQALSLINQLLPKSSSKMKSFLYYERSFFASTEDDVLADLRGSLTANPRNNDSLYRLYEIYYGKKDWRRAQYYLKQVLSNDPSNEDVMKKVSELDSLLGK